MLRSPFARLLLALVAFGVVGPFLPLGILTALFSFSCLVKDFLALVLPAAVALFVASALAPFGRRTPLLLFCLALFELGSNGLSTLLAMCVGAVASMPVELPQGPATGLEAWFRLHHIAPTWWNAQTGVAVGLAAGLLVALGPLRQLALSLNRGRTFVQSLLSRWFLPAVPLFVVGFTADLWWRGALDLLVGPFLWTLLWLLLGLTAYLLLLFGIGSGFSPPVWWRALVNCLPSGTLAATSMSSVATLPVTILAAEKNLRHPFLARLLIPATVNIQMPGDCFANIFLALALLPAFGLSLPSWEGLALFAGVFVLSRFAAAGVTGGAILIMLPLYERYLGFSPEMCSVMIALNLLLDPVITAANVLGNGALAMVFERFLGRHFVQPEGPVWS
jgi:hypothetical protein